MEGEGANGGGIPPLATYFVFSSKYTVERYTSDLRVPYYVKPDFLKAYKGSLHRVEQSVEEDYISNLRMGCYRERSQSETLLLPSLVPVKSQSGI